MKILLVSHGDLAKGMFHSLNFFIEELADVAYLCFNKEESAEAFGRRLALKINENASHSHIIFTDIIGGTPANQASLLASDSNNKIVCGYNLGMLIETLLLKDTLPLNELLDQITQSGKEGIQLLDIGNKSNDDLETTL